VEDIRWREGWRERREESCAHEGVEKGVGRSRVGLQTIFLFFLLPLLRLRLLPLPLLRFLLSLLSLQQI